MDSTLESATTETKTYKEGQLIKGKDFIRLESPLVLPSKNTPLLTEAQDLVGAINELKKGLDEGGSDEWQLPESWIDIPEPTTNQVIMMVEIDTASVDSPVLAILLFSQDGAGFYTGTESINWGDGYIDYLRADHRDTYAHQYSNAGQYIVTVNCSDTINCLTLSTSLSSNSAYINGELVTSSAAVNPTVLRAIIFGNDTALYNEISTSYYGIIYLKFKGAFIAYRNGSAPRFQNFNFLCKLICNIPPDSLTSSAFYNCYNLQDADFAENILAVPTSAFSNCYSLRKVNLQNATDIGASAFYNCYNVSEANMPSISNIQNNAFAYCTKLQKVTYADGCTIDTSSFNGCLGLYPKP